MIESLHKMMSHHGLFQCHHLAPLVVVVVVAVAGIAHAVL